MLTALLNAFACVLGLDASHCTRWVASYGELRCAEVTLKPMCETEDGWHEVFQGIPVCSRACEGGKPTA